MSNSRQLLTIPPPASPSSSSTGGRGGPGGGASSSPPMPSPSPLHSSTQLSGSSPLPTIAAATATATTATATTATAAPAAATSDEFPIPAMTRVSAALPMIQTSKHVNIPTASSQRLPYSLNIEYGQESQIQIDAFHASLSANFGLDELPDWIYTVHDDDSIMNQDGQNKEDNGSNSSNNSETNSTNCITRQHDGLLSTPPTTSCDFNNPDSLQFICCPYTQSTSPIFHHGTTQLITLEEALFAATCANHEDCVEKMLVIVKKQLQDYHDTLQSGESITFPIKLYDLTRHHGLCKNSIFHKAAFYGYTGILQQFLACHNIPDDMFRSSESQHTNSFQATPILAAIWGNNIPAFQLLMRRALPLQRNIAVFFAAQLNRPNCLHVLLNEFRCDMSIPIAHSNPLNEAIIMNNTICVDMILKSRNIDLFPTSVSASLLQTAVGLRRYHCVQSLLKYDLELVINAYTQYRLSQNSPLVTPLALALLQKDHNMVAILLQSRYIFDLNHHVFQFLLRGNRVAPMTQIAIPSFSTKTLSSLYIAVMMACFYNIDNILEHEDGHMNMLHIQNEHIQCSAVDNVTQSLQLLLKMIPVKLDIENQSYLSSSSSSTTSPIAPSMITTTTTITTSAPASTTSSNQSQSLPSSHITSTDQSLPFDINQCYFLPQESADVLLSAENNNQQYGISGSPYDLPTVTHDPAPLITTLSRDYVPDISFDSFQDAIRIAARYDRSASCQIFRLLWSYVVYEHAEWCDKLLGVLSTHSSLHFQDIEEDIAMGQSFEVISHHNAQSFSLVEQPSISDMHNQPMAATVEVETQKTSSSKSPTRIALPRFSLERSQPNQSSRPPHPTQPPQPLAQPPSHHHQPHQPTTRQQQQRQQPRQQPPGPPVPRRQISFSPSFASSRLFLRRRASQSHSSSSLARRVAPTTTTTTTVPPQHSPPMNRRTFVNIRQPHAVQQGIRIAEMIAAAEPMNQFSLVQETFSSFSLLHEASFHNSVEILDLMLAWCHHDGCLESIFVSPSPSQCDDQFDQIEMIDHCPTLFLHEAAGLSAAVPEISSSLSISNQTTSSSSSLTLIECAILGNAHLVVPLLLDQSFDSLHFINPLTQVSPLHLCASYGCLLSLQALIDYERHRTNVVNIISPQQHDLSQTTAVSNNNTEQNEKMKYSSVQINWNITEESCGRTALHVALHHQRLSWISLFLQYLANDE